MRTLLALSALLMLSACYVGPYDPYYDEYGRGHGYGRDYRHDYGNHYGWYDHDHDWRDGHPPGGYRNRGY